MRTYHSLDFHLACLSIFKSGGWWMLSRPDHIGRGLLSSHNYNQGVFHRRTDPPRDRQTGPLFLNAILSPQHQ